MYCGFWSKFSSDNDRRKAYHLIVGAREREEANPSLTVRPFAYPKHLVNMDAQEVMDLLDFDEIDKSYITESPLTKVPSFLKQCFAKSLLDAI